VKEEGKNKNRRINIEIAEGAEETVKRRKEKGKAKWREKWKKYAPPKR
jgi:hypothetical protein